jgi:AraC-like DNA-binding protein
MVTAKETLHRTTKITEPRQFRVSLPRGTYLHIAEANTAANAASWHSPSEFSDGLVLHIHRAPCRLRIRDDDGNDRHAEVPEGKIIGYAAAGRSQIRYSGNPDLVALHLSDAALAAVADEIGAALTGSFTLRSGSLFEDVCTSSLVQLLITEMPSGPQRSQAFLLHGALALAIHVATRLGAFAPRDALSKGGLAPWQLRRAQDMFQRELSGTVSLTAVAEACGLSVSHFSRAFRRSVGAPPHTWLVRSRVENAKDLMRRAETPLAEIALSCGFADQSHFTRVFSREVGKSPGQWRRCLAA